MFDSKALETKYAGKWQDKSVVNGKTIDLEGIKKGGFDIEEFFDQLGWTSLLKIDEPQYPKLVKALYAAANVSKRDTSLNVILKGVHMELTPSHCARFWTFVTKVLISLPSLGTLFAKSLEQMF